MAPICVLTVTAAQAVPPWEMLRPAVATRFALDPAGDDAGPGTPDRPFRTIARAQRAVRSANGDGDVVVTLATGIYRIDRPLTFGAGDGGQDGHLVTWRAADGASPVVSGGGAVTGWTLYDSSRGIYVADVPVGVDARQLWVDDRLAPRARIEVPRSAVAFDAEGLTIRDARFDGLSGAGGRIEVEGTGHFTDRFAPVATIRGRKLVMRQPAWRNNVWGYDTLSVPVEEKAARLYLVNALGFLTEAGSWYLDPAAGKLYLKPPTGRAIADLRVELPRLPYLMAISGTHDRPARDLTFEGIRFSHSSWIGPSGSEGYANQQSGAYLTGITPGYPADPIASCSWGCRAFESRRNDWAQIPAAVQVSAAERIMFDRVVFAHLGQVALGIGNDAGTHASGIGLGSRSITITRSVFTDLAAGAILAGGVGRDAHHPADPRDANRDIIVRNNRIQSVSKEYRDNAAILFTYVDHAIIVHNDVSDAPYDGIDIGWGWGLNDVGGNPTYRVRERGYYDHAANVIYDMPTLHRDATVAFNRIHGVKRLYEDGGAIYNLSASPGTRIFDNYIHDIPDRIALYLDEGSKGIVVRRNVVAGAGTWLNANPVSSFAPLRVTYGNRAIGNWYDGGRMSGGWTAIGDNEIADNVLVKGKAWPAEARAVMDQSGIEPAAGPVAYGDAK